MSVREMSYQSLWLVRRFPLWLRYVLVAPACLVVLLAMHLSRHEVRTAVASCSPSDRSTCSYRFRAKVTRNNKKQNESRYTKCAAETNAPECFMFFVCFGFAFFLWRLGDPKPAPFRNVFLLCCFHGCSQGKRCRGSRSPQGKKDTNMQSSLARFVSLCVFSSLFGSLNLFVCFWYRAAC